MGRQIVSIDFLIDSMRTIRYFADKSRDSNMHNFEITMYSQLCLMMERYFKITADELGLTIDKSRQQLEDKLDEQDNLNSDQN